MKIAYLTWGETPRSYGVFASQVLGQFIETKKIMPDDEFHFISALPVIHSGLLREKLGYFKEIKNIKKLLGDIDFSILPIFAPQNFVNSSANTFKFMHLFSHYLLKNKLKKIGPEIVHCRSYHAAWAAIAVREKYKLSYKIIFDGRGLWPEEVALKKEWKEDNKNFLFLKAIESDLLQKSDVSITVSDTMYAHYLSLKAQQVENIYLSVDFNKINKSSASNELLPSKSLTLLYLGALAENTWHKPKELLELYSHFKQEMGNTKLLVVTTSSHAYLESVFRKFSETEVVFTSTRTAEELSDVLSQADFACLPYRNKGSFAENIVGETMLGTKTVEYLVSRLPVLCNKYCGGASAIINKGNYGIVYSPENMLEVTKDSLIELLDDPITDESCVIFRDWFDYRSNAKRYKNIYRELSCD